MIVCMVVGCRRPRERLLSTCARHDPALAAAHARVVACNAVARARRIKAPMVSTVRREVEVTDEVIDHVTPPRISTAGSTRNPPGQVMRYCEACGVRFEPWHSNHYCEECAEMDMNQRYYLEEGFNAGLLLFWSAVTFERNARAT